MALVDCDECGNQLSHMASVCPSCGFDRSTQHQVAAEHSLASLVVFPIIIYFAVILGGIYIGKFDTEHTFFNSALFDISILNWLYIPILLILGGVPVFKHAWWGGWNGAVFMSIAAIYAVRFVAPELAPF